jgi:hypothetical protein
VKGHPISIGQILAILLHHVMVNSGNPDTNPSFSQERTFQMGRRNELIFQEPIMIQR